MTTLRRIAFILGLFFMLLGLAAVSHAADTIPCVAIQAPQHHYPKGVQRAWDDNTTLWPQHKTLRVLFIEGTSRQQNAAWKRFQTVDALVNLSFALVKTGPAEIRVGFGNTGHWSYVGTGCLNVPSGQRTMNLQLDASLIGGDPSSEWDRVAIHEICHAVGLQHEHQHPASAIHWNKPAVYAYYGQTQGWSKAQIDFQVLNPPKVKNWSGTPWDGTSIMEYPVPKGLTTDGLQIGWNYKLSARDISFLKQIYP